MRTSTGWGYLRTSDVVEYSEDRMTCFDLFMPRSLTRQDRADVVEHEVPSSILRN